MGNNAGLFSRIKNIIIPPVQGAAVPTAAEVTNNGILQELVECFEASCKKESVGGTLLFNTHFIIVLHPEVFESRMPSLPAIVKEAVKSFYTQLRQLKPKYEEITPVSPSWHFKFGPGAAFNNEVLRPTDIRVIGMLAGPKDASLQAARPSATAKVTMKVKATNVFDRMDINPDAFRHIDFKESGTFSVKFNDALEYGSTATVQTATTQASTARGILAQIEYYLGDQHKEELYLMKDKEIVVARKDAGNSGYSNYLLVDSPYVSNPHMRIRYNEGLRRFQLASFSRNETRVNEQLIPRSDFSNPQWADLASNAQILLNSVITLQFKSTIQP